MQGQALITTHDVDERFIKSSATKPNPFFLSEGFLF